MKTTNFVIEILITGFQVVIWMALIILSVFGYDWVKITSEELLSLTFFATIVSYPLGVVFDNVWGHLAEKIDRPIRKEYFREPDKLHGIRIKIFSANRNMAEFTEYIRSRMRVARASFYNFSLITLTSAVFIITQLGDIDTALKKKLFLFVVISGASLTFLAFNVYKKLVHTYYNQLSVINKEFSTRISENSLDSEE